MRLALQSHHGHHGYQGQMGYLNSAGITSSSSPRRLSSTLGSMAEFAMEIPLLERMLPAGLTLEPCLVEPNNCWNTSRLGLGLGVGSRPSFGFVLSRFVIFSVTKG